MQSYLNCKSKKSRRSVVCDPAAMLDTHFLELEFPVLYASAKRFYHVPTIYVLSKNKKNIKIFQPKLIIISSRKKKIVYFVMIYLIHFVVKDIILINSICCVSPMFEFGVSILDTISVHTADFVRKFTTPTHKIA